MSAAEAIALTSACGPPYSSCQPSPTTRASLTMTPPTPRSASSIARARCPWSVSVRCTTPSSLVGRPTGPGTDYPFGDRCHKAPVAGSGGRGIALGEQAEEQRPHEELTAFIAAGDRSEQREVRAVPEDRVDGDDRRRVLRRSPVRGEVDDRRRQTLGEEDVAAEVAVHDLARGVDRRPGIEETCHLGDASEVAARLLSPRDAIGARPHVGPGIEHLGGAGDADPCAVEAPPPPNDVRPPGQM